MKSQRQGDVRVMDESSVTRVRLLGWTGTLVTAILIAQVVTGFLTTPDYAESIELGKATDVLHERATAWEGLFGDPYRPVGEVMADHGYPQIGGGVAVRTPGAVLLELPLLLVPESVLLTVTVSTVLILLVAALHLAIKISGVNERTLVWLGPAYFISIPAVMSLAFGSVMVLVPVFLILLTWANVDKHWAGIPLGLAASSRLWPLLLLIGLWIAGRRRTALEAASAFLVFSMVGLSLPGVTWAGTLDVLSTGGRDWVANPQNASLASLLAPLSVEAWLAVAAASLGGVWLAVRKPRKALPITAISALLSSPLSWPSYAITALPALACWGRRAAPILVALVSIPWVAWIFIPAPWRGYAMCASLACLLFFVVASDEPVRTDAAEVDSGQSS